MDRPRKSPGPGLHAPRKAAPTTPQAPHPAPRATTTWPLSPAPARSPRRPPQGVSPDLHEDRPPARIRYANFPLDANAAKEVAHGELPNGTAQGRREDQRDRKN